jgi:hypothetical protein
MTRKVAPSQLSLFQQFSSALAFSVVKKQFDSITASFKEPKGGLKATIFL